MPGRQAPRFALEAAFLVLLAVLAGVADLRWQVIVLVMAAAWVLIALLEWAFWREGPRLPPVPRGYVSWAPAATPPIPPPVAREEATRIIEPADIDPEPVEPEPEPEPVAVEPEPAPLAVEAEPEPDSVAAEPEPRPEPEAAPRRPWWWRRREPEDEAEPERPRHVRVLPPERNEREQ